jgi:hypothetical protein
VTQTSDTAARHWTSGHVEHLRGRKVWSTQNDLQLGVGTVVATVNYNVDTRTGVGTAWGSFRSDFGGRGGFEGTFRGPIRPTVSGPVGTWKVVARGWGDQRGVQVRGTSTEHLLSGTSTYTGVAFRPGDR